MNRRSFGAALGGFQLGGLPVVVDGPSGRTAVTVLCFDHIVERIGTVVITESSGLCGGAGETATEGLGAVIVQTL